MIWIGKTRRVALAAGAMAAVLAQLPPRRAAVSQSM
jgi:hypothetical protein